MPIINGNNILSIVKVEGIPLTVLLKVGDNLKGRTVVFNTSTPFTSSGLKSIVTSHISTSNMKDYIGVAYDGMGYINAGASEGAAETHFIAKFADENGDWLMDQYTFPTDADIIIESIITADFWNKYIKAAVTVDSEMSDTSANPVENRVVKAYVDAVDTKATAAKATAEELDLEVANLKSIVYDTVATVAEKVESYADIVPVPSTVTVDSTAKPLIDNTLAQIAKIEGNSDVYMPNAPDLDDAVIYDSNIIKIEAFSQLCDEELELGNIDYNTGENNESSTNLRSKNYYNVLPSSTVFFKLDGSDNIRLFAYDKTHNFIGSYRTSGWNNTSDNNISPNNTAFSVPSSCYFFRFFLTSSYGTTYKNDISIYYGSTNRGYIPYRTKEIAINQTLKGAANAHDYIVFEEQENGTFNEVKVTNIDNVDLGTLNWSYDNGNQLFYVSPTNMSIALSNFKVNASCLCEKYICGNTYFSSIQNMELSVNSSGFFSANQRCLLVKNTSYTDATTFKTAMSGVMLNYELETPTTEIIATGLTLDDVTLLVNKGGYIKVTEAHQNYTSIYWQTYGVNPNLTMAYIVKDFKTEA